MTTENVSADVNSESQASGDIDAQLGQMRDTEKVEVQEPAKDEVQEPAEVKVKEEKVVPLAALHEERNMRKQLQVENAQNRQMIEKVNQRLEMLMNPRPQAPDPAQDPVGYIDHRIQGLEQTIKPVLQSQQANTEATQRDAYAHHLKSAVVASAQEMLKSTPDLPQASGYLNEMRARELTLLGVPQHQAQMQAVQELDQALMTWAHQGVNPAQMAYEFAKARGYQAKAQASGQEKIETQQKGMAASRSLGSGGAPNQGKLTAESLAKMSDEDFAKLSESEWRKAMGA